MGIIGDCIRQYVAKAERKARLARGSIADTMQVQGASPREISEVIIPNRNHMDNSEAPYHPYPF